MWRSFGQGAGGPMGGGGGGGGGIMKTFHKAVSAGTGGRGSSQESFSRCATTHYSSNTTTSPTSRPSYKPSSSDYNSNTYSSSSVNQLNRNRANSISPTTGEEYDGVNGFYDDYVFCTVPSMDEVHDAVSSLQQVIDPPELDWIEPSRSMLQSPGYESVYDAFHLLQTEPSVKRMVISLASDNSVWDAVMNNEVVRELRDSVYEANKSIIPGEIEGCDDSFPVSGILNWIFINIKAKAMEIFEKITEMMNSLFQSPRNDRKKATDEDAAMEESFEKKLTSSFLLSVMVLLIVVVSRANK
ncbi:hypothetical protein Lser_V15G09203 [Lactuca serriola]